MSANKLSDVYIILTKGYFAPQVVEEESDSFLEPFQSSFQLFNDAIIRHKQHLPWYLSISKTPFWDKALFIPSIGQITYDHRKNVASRLLTGGLNLSTNTSEDYSYFWDSDDSHEVRDPEQHHFPFRNRQYKFTFPSSAELPNVMHLPLLIHYRKKVKTSPELRSYVGKSGSRNVDKMQRISQQCRMYIHFYTYGLCFVHLAISVSSEGFFAIDDMIAWLRDLKGAEPKQAIKVAVRSMDLSFDSVEQFFDHIWRQISASVLKKSSIPSLSTPLYDSIRIKPLQRLKENEIARFVQENPGHFVAEENIRTFKKEWSFNFEDASVPLGHLWIELARAQNCFLSNNTISNPPRFFRWFDAEPATFRHIHTYYAKMLNDVILQQIRKYYPIMLPLKAVAGLLSKSRNWQDLRVNDSEYESLYGRYEGDFILPKSQSTLIVTNVWSRRKQLQLLFQWELVAVSEIAYGQKLIFSYFAERMASTRKQAFEDIPESFVGLSTLSFLHGQMRIHRHLAPRFRKWYYILAEAISLNSRAKELSEHLEGYYAHKALDDVRRRQAHIYYYIGRRIDTKTQLITDRLLRELRQNSIEQGVMQRSLDAIRRTLKYILSSEMPISDRELIETLNNIYQSVNSNLDLNQQLELTLPIIPFLLEYKIGLNAGSNLGAVWDELIARVKNKKGED